MKRIKNTFAPILLALVFGLVTKSCKNDFSEEDVLQSQKELTQEQAKENAAAITLASGLLDYSITLHDDESPVAEATITITNQKDGSVATTTTDQNGNALFVDILLGGYHVAVSATSFANFSYMVDFGSLLEGVHYQNINNKIVPIETSEASKIEVFRLDGESAATIKGVVSIETDLTNSAPEVPQDITIRANLDAEVNAQHSRLENSNGVGNTSIYIEGSFTFTQGNIGIALVDNTSGEYSMQVPANVKGTEIELLFPLVEAGQRLAYSNINGADEAPQVGVLPAVFGPDITPTTTPAIPNVIAEFDPVPLPGRGFTMPIERRGRNSILPAQLNGLIDDFPIEEDFPNVKFRATQGSGYQISPTVTITAPESVIDTIAGIHADMLWDFQSITITDGGSGYNPFQDVFVRARFTLEDDMTSDVFLAIVEADGSGSLPTGIIDLNVPEEFTHQVFDVELIFGATPGTLPTGTLTYSGKVDVFHVYYAGFGYTTVPDFEISGGDPTEPATLEVTDMAFRHFTELDNSTISQPYVLLPEIQYTYANVPGNKITDTRFLASNLNEDGDFSVGQIIDPLEDYLKVEDHGLDFNKSVLNTVGNSGKKVHAYLDQMSYITPEVLIIEPEHEQTTASVIIKDGEITGLENIYVGRGYNSAYGLTLKTLDGLTEAGSGATIALTGFLEDLVTTEHTWSENYTITNPGSGYSEHANIAEEPFSGPVGAITVKNGEVKIINVNYGTGRPVDDLGTSN
ncbi:carboxypeptidase regulatory-like domain-containing protein [Flagellimonas hymeniacidonis]|uniref:Carboxypeptidase regulatory-like domain-containing protein n=1 Tax=Flagellimonas hymeniacidonis TaxID=2603628 RepID=A0A5C8V190_9FLAO|nr:carboxypeptidase-like regulatory domain-containing protein [Flagellimonas hymeniacidonis]TXN35573.1 carboxypeptidase regulatory-like domain-containing protein [Flagellimonas hymeniacidonis]